MAKVKNRKKYDSKKRNAVRTEQLSTTRRPPTLGYLSALREATSKPALR
jgi:hypothetical protein